MNCIKHILLMFSLLTAAMPCTHAMHGHHAVDEAVPASMLLQAHCCDCHGCEPEACTDIWRMPGERVLTQPAAITPSFSVLWSACTDTVPRFRPVIADYRYTPMPLETILLLI